MSEVEVQIALPRRESPWAIAGIFTLGVVMFALLLSSPMLVRTFLFQPFNIPSGSMKPTLLVGDYFFVSKYAYGYSRLTWPLSWPFSPPNAGRFWSAEPTRGDVVAFALPKDTATVYIKRVVGLPGDRIQMKAGVLFINDIAVVRARLSDAIGLHACDDAPDERVKRWRETLPNGVSYETLDCVDNGYFDNTNVYTVPAGQYFMLGDNRDNSSDSRVQSAIGYIPGENLIGRAGMIFYSFAGGTKDERPGIRFKRIGTMVR